MSALHNKPATVESLLTTLTELPKNPAGGLIAVLLITLPAILLRRHILSVKSRAIGDCFLFPPVGLQIERLALTHVFASGCGLAVSCIFMLGKCWLITLKSSKHKPCDVTRLSADISVILLHTLSKAQLQQLWPTNAQNISAL